MFQHSVVELKCTSCTGLYIICAFIVYYNDNGIQSCTFGSDYAVANVTYGLTKMRFKQGIGNTSGFKHFLRCENIKPELLFDM